MIYLGKDRCPYKTGFNEYFEGMPVHIISTGQIGKATGWDGFISDNTEPYLLYYEILIGDDKYWVPRNEFETAI
jgi:hypothetical protein